MMDSLFKKQHMGELLLAILFIIYLIMGYKTPGPLANMIDTLYGKVIVVILPHHVCIPLIPDRR